MTSDRAAIERRGVCFVGSRTIVNALTPAQRMKYRRMREAQGLVVLPIEVNEHALANVLLDRGLPAETREQLALGAARLLGEALSQACVTRNGTCRPTHANLPKHGEENARTSEGTRPAA